ncbi:MAG: ABC transporter substrate-binding protein [Sporichthyaceae bacterium]
MILSRQRPRRAVAIAAFAVFALAACAAEPGDAVLAPQATPSATAPPVAGGTLRIGIAGEPGVLDPHDYNGEFLVKDAIYDPLVSYGPGGEIQPALAEAWTIAPDGLTVTFDLRDGVSFHDGTVMDAAAVKWNFDRWVANERHSFFRASSIIETVTATDADTLTLGLERPYEPLLQELTFVRPTRMLSPTSVTADQAYQSPVGTGAWKLESQSATGARLVRNENYWGTKPLLDAIEFTVIPDSQSRLAALKAAEIDVIGGSYLAPITPVEARELSTTTGIEMLTADPDVAVVLGFNAEGLAGEKAVREAIDKAIDTTSLVQALYLGYGEPGKRFFPPGVPNGGGDLALGGFDVASANTVLDAAGWVRSGQTRTRNGEELRLDLLISSTPANGQQDARGSAEALADQLRTVGVGVDIVAVDSAAYFETRSEGKYDLAFFESYGAPYDPSSSAVTFFTNDTRYPLWATEETGRLLDEALYAVDATARTAAYVALYAALAADVAFVPLVYRPRIYAVREEVDGFTLPVTEYGLSLAGVTIRG